ncbi:MAG TPA: O-antigen ligase family protein [Brevundimonas sp.]|nr:O-antigen ligase family protein [Brevundimonas sp.]
MAPPAEAPAAPRLLDASSWSDVVELVRRDGPNMATWALPFLLTVYLGLKGGGYNVVVRNEIGVVVWWIVLLGALTGVLPSFRLGRLGWVGLGLLTAFAAWTTLGTAWSSSSERSLIEASRVAVYLGVFALALSMRRPGSLKRTINGLACGIGAIAVFALLSWLHPEWFPTDEARPLFAVGQVRLNYPLDYWNDLALLMAMGIPLLLGIAVRGATVVGRALSAALVPVLALTAFYTLSRGGALEAAVGVGVFLAVAPRRLTALPSVGVAGAGSALLIAAAAQRDDLANGLSTPAAGHQADEMLAVTIIVCGGVALLQAAIGLAQKYELGPRIEVPKRTAVPLAAGTAVVVLVIAIAAGLPKQVSDEWSDFKQPVAAGYGVQRFTSSNGNGRYQTWDSAIDASRGDVITGVGPGTYEYWWAQNGSVPVFVRDAHSLYLETLGELGLIGFFLIAGFVFTVLGVGVQRSTRGGSTRRWPYAAVTASAAAFAVGAGIDWAWELSVIPVAFMILAAGLLSPRSYREPSRRMTWRNPRLALGATAIAGLVLIAIPLRGAQALQDSQRAATDGDLTKALEDARTAHDRQPYAASPLVQEALVLELMKDYNGAVTAARSATVAEATNWRTWLVLSRTEAEAGDPRASVRAYEQARSLNPRSPLFAFGQTQGAQ